MEDGQADNTADKLEVIEVLWVDTRMGINLQGIIIVGGVFEKAVEGVEHFVRQKKEEFTGNIVSTSLISPESVIYRERPP